MNITMTREALLDRLAGRLELAKKEDAKIKAEHVVAEQKCLAEFRKTLKTADKWDYATLKKHYFRVECRKEAPSCPKSEADQIARILQLVKLDTRKSSFPVTHGTDLARAVNWIPRNDRPKEDMC